MVNTEDVPRFSERIYKEAQRLIRLVEDIIQLSQLDEGPASDRKEAVPLRSLAEEVVSRPGTGCRAEGDQLKPYLRGDRGDGKPSDFG